MIPRCQSVTWRRLDNAIICFCFGCMHGVDLLETRKDACAARLVLGTLLVLHRGRRGSWRRPILPIQSAATLASISGFLASLTKPRSLPRPPGPASPLPRSRSLLQQQQCQKETGSDVPLAIFCIVARPQAQVGPRRMNG